MTVDYLALGAVTGPVAPMVRFYVGSSAGGANYFVSNDAFSWNPNAGPDWTTHLVDLVAANFLEWPNQAAHSKTFEQVLAAPDDIGLVFCGAFTSNSTLGFSGSGTVLIDNFGVVNAVDHRATMMATPEPATLVLLACGSVWMLARRRKTR